MSDPAQITMPTTSDTVEIVYILVNEAMPGLVKIGKTNDLRRRLSQLSNHTGVPAPFDVFYAAKAADMGRVERLMHDAFEDRRLFRKEFFRVSAEQARAALRLAEGEEVTATAQREAVSVLDSEAERQAVRAGRKRRENTTFSMLCIPPDSVLEYRRDRSVTCVVFDDWQVTYNGEQWSVSGLTLFLIRNLEGREWSSARGWDQWMYRGEVLTAIRDQMMPNADMDDAGE